jgi:hypothetical protein
MGWLVALALTAIRAVERTTDRREEARVVARHGLGPAPLCQEDEAPLNYLPLTPVRLRERSEEVYSSGVFTLVSILQGATLAILAATAGAYFIDAGASPTWEEQLLVSLRSFSVLVVMAVVIYEYTWFGAVIRRPPKAIDAFIPVILGATEIGMASAITSPGAWWAFTAAFLLVSGLALVHSRFHLMGLDFQPPDVEAGNRKSEVRRIIDSGYRTLIAYTIVAALLLPSAFFAFGRILGPLTELVPILLLMGTGLFAVLKSERMLDRLYGQFEVRR